MIKEVIKNIINEFLLKEKEATPPSQQKEPDLRSIGIFSDIQEEGLAELAHALMYLNETNKNKKQQNKEPIKFYLSTYGGSADDMFALYDVM